MDWYKKAKRPGKTKRHDRSTITLYHVSPDRLNRLSPRSTFNNTAGAYVSPSYKSIIRDWMWYVKNKKHKKHPLEMQQKELANKQIELQEKDRTPEEEIELEMITNKRDKIEDSMMGKEYQKSVEGYQKLYIHKIACPRNVYKQASNFFEGAYDEGYRKDNFFFWGWGEQIFIPEQLLPELRIIGIEELNTSQIHDKSEEFDRRRYMQ